MTNVSFKQKLQKFKNVKDRGKEEELETKGLRN